MFELSNNRCCNHVVRGSMSPPLGKSRVVTDRRATLKSISCLVSATASASSAVTWFVRLIIPNSTFCVPLCAIGATDTEHGYDQMNPWCLLTVYTCVGDTRDVTIVF